eukprot:2924344-Ditylum_brightwellii.AAC.2
MFGNKGRTLIHKANYPMAIKYKMFPEAFMTATLLDGLVVVKVDGVKKTCYEHFHGIVPKFAKYLHTWGKAGTIKSHKKTIANIDDRGIMCMFVEYTIKHEGSHYEMLEPRMSIVYESWDVIWFWRLYYSKPVNESYTNKDDLLQWTDNMEPKSNQSSREETKAKEVDAKEDGVVGTSEGDYEPNSEMFAPTTTHSGYITKLPQYLVDSYNLSNEYEEISQILC